MTAILECRSVTKSFGALRAVNDITFSVQRNEVLGITGPNGAGKTTLFEVVSGFSRASSGTVHLGGEDITELAPHVICSRGMMRVFQSAAAFDTLTAWQNVYIGHAFSRRHPPLMSLLRITREDRASCLEALERVGLAHRANTRVAELPVLERKFLMIASALVSNPSILMLDEPVGGLTQDEIDQVFDLLTSLRKNGATIVVIEHVMRFMVKIADRVMVMHHGEMIFDGEPGRLARDETVRSIYLGEKEASRIAGAEERKR